MAPLVTAFLAVSLDGFIARPDGGLDWLDQAGAAAPPGEDFGFEAFLASADVLVLGRHTFQTVLGFDPWPYPGKRVIALSSRRLPIPPERAEAVSWSDESPEALVRRLGAEGVGRVYVDGGVTVQRFLAAGLLHELTLTLIPVLLGEGRRLFGPLPADRRLELVEARPYPCGFVQLRYRVPPA